jgi:hypothetical protein
MAAAPPPPRRLIRQNAVVLNHGNFPPVPIQPLMRQQALGFPNNLPVPVTTPNPIAQPPRSNLPRTEKQRKRWRSTRRRRMSTRRRAY